MSDLLAALDVGTTSVRAMVFDPGGATLSHAALPLRSTFPQPGWVEQDPRELFEHSRDVLEEACAPFATRLRGLGIATQRSSVVAWDSRSLEPLAPMIGWQDTRTAGRSAELQALGIPANTQASATKIEWLFRHVPALAAAAEAATLRIGTPDAWITARLGAGCTDPTNASTTLLYDITTAEWHPGLLELFDVDPGWLPPVRPTAEVFGETTIGGAAVPLAARAGDQQAASFGLGICRAGDAKLTLGTSAMLDVNTGSDVRAPNGTYPLALWQLHDEPLTFCAEGSVHAAGSTMQWLVELGVLPAADELDTVVARANRDHGVAVVPALYGLGAPHADDAARGRIDGLTRGSTAADVVAAAVQGVAHSCADLCDALELAEATPLRVDGGLAQSDAMIQMLADATGRTMLRSTRIESTAFGAALLAGVATGVYASAEDAAHAARFDDPIEPREPAAGHRARWAESVERARSDWASRPRATS